MSRPKDQGTRWESFIVHAARIQGLEANRLPEGGPNDRGDLTITATDGTMWIVEAKNRTQLNIHAALDKAATKADPDPAAVIWKRLTRKKGNTKRTQPGPPIVAITLHNYLNLLRKPESPRMTAPSKIVTRNGRKVYQWNGNIYERVTHILDQIPKPFLMWWAGNQVAEFAVDNINVVSALTLSDREAALELLKKAHRRSTNKAANLGTAIHKACEQHANGQTPDIPEGGQRKFDAYLQWVNDWNPTIEATELRVFNDTHQYAGTLDMVAKVNGTRQIVDIKTGKNVYPEVVLQCCAYAHAEQYELPNGGGKQLEPGWVNAASVLHLTDAGYNFHRLDINHPAVWDCFIGLRKVHSWQDIKDDTITPYLTTVQ